MHYFERNIMEVFKNFLKHLHFSNSNIRKEEMGSSKIFLFLTENTK